MDDRTDHGEAVAIIGMACRFPGARDPVEFHDLAVAGRHMFTPAGHLAVRPLRGGLLDDWSGSRRESGNDLRDLGPEPDDPDPARKLAAETAALALADAGLRELAGRRRIGLLMACATPGVGELVRQEFGFEPTGGDLAPAEASSLHAVIAAAAALAAGELDLAIAGGAELGTDPVWLALQDRAGTLGTDEMRVYAADPAGLLPGEGCGVVVLARTADARAAGLPIYAELAGWGTGPALAEAYRQAAVDPADVQLFEGQGTGTAVSDSAELAALTQLRLGAAAPAPLGAISAQIGYARAASGAASLIKVAVAMTAGMIPPGPRSLRPHPLIDSDGAPLRLPAQAEPWPEARHGSRLAAVNSLGPADPAAMLGAAGLDDADRVHLLLRREDDRSRWAGRRRRSAEMTPQPAPVAAKHARTAPASPGPGPGEQAAAEGGAYASRGVAGESTPGATEEVPASPAEASGAVEGPRATVTSRAAETPRAAVMEPDAGGSHAFVFCGADAGALAGRLEVIAASATVFRAAELPELARRLALGALHDSGCDVPLASGDAAPLRAALSAASPGQLAVRARLAARRLRTSGADPAPAEPGIFLSTGASGRVAVLFPGRAEAPAAQPGLFAAALAALPVLDRLGIRPVAGVGYGLGEITALVWAGSLTAAEGARLVAQYGQVLRCCVRSSGVPGAMARVAADEETARKLCAAARLHVAAYDGPREHVLAGPVAGIRELARRAATLGLAVDVLGSTGALHSPAMAACTAPWRQVLADACFSPPRRRLISTVTGSPVAVADDLGELLAGQAAGPVLFAQAMARVAGEADLTVLAGPDDGLVAAAAASARRPAIAIPRQARPGRATAAGSSAAGLPLDADGVAALFAAAVVTDLTPFLAAGPPAPPSNDTGTLAFRTVPRMRDGESPTARTGDANGQGGMMP